MEYTQITLDDWLSMKERLKKDLIGVQESFVRIGYTLRKIEDQELYQKDGYKSIAEFAQAEYGLSPSTVSRFISINRKYSIDGYSETLRPEFAQLGSSKLSEMLSLPDQDLEMIQPEATREGIRELKQFNREEPTAGQADDIKDLVEQFFRANPEILNELYSSEAYITGETDKLVEIVNPGGNKAFRKGLYFLMMYEKEIKIKKFGSTPQTMAWIEFFTITREIFGEAAAGRETWQNYFGKDELDKEEPEEVKTDDSAVEEPVEQEESIETEEIAPAQKTAEILEKEPENQGEKEETDTREFKEHSEEPKTEPEVEQGPEKTEPNVVPVNEHEIIDKPFGTRKDYFDSLTAYGMALQLAAVMRDVVSEESIKAAFWENWLNEEVDDRGRTIDTE